MRRGFTLIELLVVIAIIAILAAILFPVFARAREKARQSTCGSNLKQLALGVLMYVQDYDECFPRMYSYNYNSTELRWWEDLVQPYVKNWQMTVCPSQSPYSYTAARPPEGPNPLLYNYSCNAVTVATTTSPNGGWGTGGCMQNGTTAIGQVAAPSQHIMVCESNTREMTYANLTDCWDSDDGYIRKKHSDVSNWAFADGHVKAMKQSEPFMWSRSGTHP